MTQYDQADQQRREQHPPQEGLHERKQRVLTKRTPSIVRSIADARILQRRRTLVRNAVWAR